MFTRIPHLYDKIMLEMIFMKKIIFILTIVLLMPVYNVNAFNKYKIKNTYTPNSTILYKDEKHFKVLTGKEKEDSYFNKKEFKEYVTPTLDENYKGVTYEIYPDPCKGLYIQYGSDGEVNRIYTKKNQTVYSNLTIQGIDTRINDLIVYSDIYAIQGIETVLVMSN